jgi:hypothetical protein
MRRTGVAPDEQIGLAKQCGNLHQGQSAGPIKYVRTTPRNPASCRLIVRFSYQDNGAA